MHSLYANTVSCYMRNEHLWTVAFIGDFVTNTFRILREECIIESDERKEVKNESCALQKQKQFFGKGAHMYFPTNHGLNFPAAVLHYPDKGK